MRATKDVIASVNGAERGEARRYAAIEVQRAQIRKLCEGVWDPWRWVEYIAAPSEAEVGDTFVDMRGGLMQERQAKECSVDGRST